MKCQICKRNFTSFHKMKSHMRLLNHEPDVYICDFSNCGSRYAVFNSYRRHYVRCHGSLGRQPSFALLDTANYSGSTGGNDDNTETPPDQSLVVANDSVESSLSARSALLAKFNYELSDFVSMLYQNPQIPLSFAEETYSATARLLNNAILPIFTENDDERLVTIAETLKTQLASLSTYYKRKQFLQRTGSFIPPHSYVIGKRQDLVKRGGRRCLRALESTAHMISLRKMLKKFFSMEDILLKTLDHVNNLMNGSPRLLRHFVQGSFWKSRVALHGENTVLPFFLFVDDFEPLNSLGSHSSIYKLGAAYVSLPCLPPIYSSQLTNIFLTLLYHSGDRSRFGNGVIFQPLIEEINLLIREGLEFDVPGFKGTVFFDLGAITGDNLGIHTIIGMVESFSSNFSCRACKIDKKTLATQFYEDPLLLRNKTNYDQDLAVGNVSLTGVKEKCIWLNVDNFDLFQQIGVDVMHDLNEGVIKYILTALLVTFIDVKKYFTIDFLNNKIVTFDFGADSSNKPVTLDMKHLRMGNLRLSATEVCNFMLYLSNMVGDVIPHDDSYWEVYKQLRLVYDLVMTRAFLTDHQNYLQQSIAELCSMYTRLFSVSLKPKFHNMLHYPAAMLKFGPLQYLSAVRFEAKHRVSKLASKATCNRMNLPKTLATKHQLTLSHIFIKNKLDSSFIFGREQTGYPRKTAEIANFFGCDVKNVKRVRWAERGALRFEIGTVLIYDVGMSGGVSFISVDNVYSLKPNKLIFSGFLYNTIGFDDHYHAFEVLLPNNSYDVKYLDFDMLYSPFPCHIGLINHQAPPRYFVTIRKPL